HDAAGDASGAGADALLVEHDHVGALLGQVVGSREPVHAGAEDDEPGGRRQRGCGVHGQCPETACGAYGSSSRATSSGLSSSCSAASASSTCLVFVAPTIGLVTAGLRSSQASATCAGGTPRSAATSRTRTITGRSSSGEG